MYKKDLAKITDAVAARIPCRALMIVIVLLTLNRKTPSRCFFLSDTFCAVFVKSVTKTMLAKTPEQTRSIKN